MSLRIIVLFLAAAVLSAGCAGPPSTKEAVPATSAPAEKEAGQIAGTITDEELMPIEGARVQLVSGSGAAPREAFSDATGAFLVDNLAPARYQLFVTHVAHRDALPKFVEVLQGETTEVNFQLEVLRVQSAFVSIVPYSFYYNVAWCFPKEFGQINSGIYCQGLGWDVANITRQFVVDQAAYGPLMTLVHEMQWTAATPVCNLGMVADLYSPQQEQLPANGNMGDPARSDNNPFHWENPTVTSPTKIYVPREGEDPAAMLSSTRTALNGGNHLMIDGKWSILHWADHAAGPGGLPIPFGCTLEERLNGYVSLFYVEPAPGPEWSALPT